MARYTIKRILWIIPILIGVITIVFFISAVTPGNPAASLLGPSACLLYTSDAADD